LSLEQYEEVLGVGVLVGKGSLKDNSKESISISIEMEFNIKAHRS